MFRELTIKINGGGGGGGGGGGSGTKLQTQGWWGESIFGRDAV